MKGRALLGLALTARLAAADPLLSEDPLRLVYSNQFAWSHDGLPIVTVGLLEGQKTVTLSAPGGRLWPSGEGGPSIEGGTRWTVRVRDGRPGKLAYRVVVARFLPSQTTALRAELARLRAQHLAPHTVEIGALFAIHGELIDSRRLLVTVGEDDSRAAAEARAATLHARLGVATAVQPELVERPRGTLEAVDEHGLTVRNEGILWFTPGSGGLIALGDESQAPSPPRRYFGKIYVTLDRQGQLAVANAVAADKLLAGLVPAEMPASAPLEALKAQAVAARNELLAKLGTRHLTDPYRLCASQHCQVYAGAGREDPRATAAVTATRGQLLVRDGGGGLVDAVYSASCGGHGEDNDRAFAGAPDPSLRGRLDGNAELAARLSDFQHIGEATVRDWLAKGPAADGPYCARPAQATRNYRWQQSIDLDGLRARAGVGPLRGLRVLGRGTSGRATRLLVVGDEGSKEITGELVIRRLLGDLKSALFVLDLSSDESGHLIRAVARGGGHGHGVGLCQTGAIGMALAGHSYLDILRHYYPASHLRKLY